MQFQVPQFIDTEDKILGPLGIKQFVYLVIAGAVSAILYFSVPAWLWVVLSLPILGLAAAMAFVKINGRPFGKFLLATLSFYWKPQTYVWQPESPRTQKVASGEEKEAAPAFSVEKLLTGMALKKTWNRVQNGGTAPEEKPPKKQRAETERYQVFHKLTGEHEAARRVDYR